MSNLKEKFGKFELGKQQVKSVKGGAVRCFVLSANSSNSSPVVWQIVTWSEANAWQQFSASEWNCCGYVLSCGRA